MVVKVVRYGIQKEIYSLISQWGKSDFLNLILFICVFFSFRVLFNFLSFIFLYNLSLNFLYIFFSVCVGDVIIMFILIT